MKSWLSLLETILLESIKFLTSGERKLWQPLFVLSCLCQGDLYSEQPWEITVFPSRRRQVCLLLYNQHNVSLQGKSWTELLVLIVKDSGTLYFGLAAVMQTHPTACSATPWITLHHPCGTQRARGTDGNVKLVLLAMLLSVESFGFNPGSMKWWWADL